MRCEPGGLNVIKEAIGTGNTVEEAFEAACKELGVESHEAEFEILDHFQAYEYLLKNLDRPLTEELLKETHRLLTEHTLSYKTQYDEIPSNPGEYTTVDMCAGDTIFGDHEQLIKQVPRLLQSTQQVLDSGKIHPIIIAAKFHGFYEYLHPFRDGNGRLGCLMTNYI